MFKYYKKDNLWYLYLDLSKKTQKTYEINPSDISWMIHVDINSSGGIHGIEIIPASYIYDLYKIKKIELKYDSNYNTETLLFSDLKAESKIRNIWPYYNSLELLTGNIEIGLFSDKIVYLKLYNASHFLDETLLRSDTLDIEEVV